MNDESAAAIIAYFKALAGLDKDCELAQALGYSKSGLSTLKQRKRVTKELWASASAYFRLSVAELKAGYERHAATGEVCNREQNRPLAGPASLYWQALQEALAENRRLYQEKEALLRENGDLRELCARLEERLKAALRGEGPDAAAQDRPEQGASVGF